MPKNELPAEGLLKLRKHHEDAARQELAERQRAMQQVQSELERIDEERQTIEDSVGGRHQGAGLFGLQLEYARYHALSVHEAETKGRLEEASRLRERAREAAVTARREVKTVERLRERAADTEAREQRRQETKALDEVGTQRAQKAGGPLNRRTGGGSS